MASSLCFLACCATLLWMSPAMEHWYAGRKKAKRRDWSCSWKLLVRMGATNHFQDHDQIKCVQVKDMPRFQPITCKHVPKNEKRGLSVSHSSRACVSHCVRRELDAEDIIEGANVGFFEQSCDVTRSFEMTITTTSRMETKTCKRKNERWGRSHEITEQNFYQQQSQRAVQWEESCQQ